MTHTTQVMSLEQWIRGDCDWVAM